MQRFATVATAFALTILPASRARADSPAPAPVSANGYRYVFPDDPLDAGFFGPGDVHIRVLPHAMRATLIRLRTNFVPEMLESVEKL